MPRQIPDEQIFAAALDIVAARGIAGATTKQIAAAAEINEVTLFRRFGSKAKLLEAALSAEVDRFDAAGGARYTGDLQGDLTRVVALYTQLVMRRGRLLAVLLAELPSADELGGLIERPQRIVRAVARLIRRYQREGALEPEPPLQSVAALLGPVLLAGVLRPLATRPEPPDPSAHVERFLHGRRATHPTKG